MLYNKSMCRFIFTILVAFLLSIFIANPCFAIGKYIFNMSNLTKGMNNISPRVLGPNGTIISSGGKFNTAIYSIQHASQEEVHTVLTTLTGWKDRSEILSMYYKEINSTLSTKLGVNANLSRAIYDYILYDEFILGKQRILKTSLNTNVLNRALTIMRVQQIENQAEIAHVVSEPENIVNIHLELEGAIKGAGYSTHIKALFNIAKNDPNLKIVEAHVISLNEGTLLSKIGFFRTESIDMCAEDRSYVNTNTSIPKPTK